MGTHPNQNRKQGDGSETSSQLRKVPSGGPECTKCSILLFAPVGYSSWEVSAAVFGVGDTTSVCGCRYRDDLAFTTLHQSVTDSHFGVENFGAFDNEPVKRSRSLMKDLF